MKLKLSKSVLSWCLYDWANSVFVTTVMVAFFPVFFKSYWCSGVGQTLSTQRFGVASTMAGIIVAVASPFLGAFADTGRDKKKLLGSFMLAGVCATAALCFIPQGAWWPALLVFVAANIGFSCSTLFYDTMLIDVAEKERMDLVSSLGFAFGYLGGGLLFAVNMLMAAQPHLFGLRDQPHAIRISFVSAAVWWLVFSVPLLMFVKCRKFERVSGARAIVTDSMARLRRTARKILQRKELLLFLIAYWLYYDGVNTFIRMAVDFGLSVGIGTTAIMLALLFVQFIAFPSSLLFGFLAGRFGGRRMIIAGIFVYLAVIVVGVIFLTRATHFIVLACITGLAQGGIQALSRSYYGKLVPREEAAEYFGFYNVVGRFAIIGPAMVGIVAQSVFAFGVAPVIASRVGMASTVVLFLAGGALLVAADHARMEAGAGT
jgi:UMF1 family MFS transporter